MYVVLSIIAVKKYYCYILLLVIFWEVFPERNKHVQSHIQRFAIRRFVFNRNDRQKVSTKHHHIFNHIFK